MRKSGPKREHTRNKVSRASYTKGEMIFFVFVSLFFGSWLILFFRAHTGIRNSTFFYILYRGCRTSSCERFGSFSSAVSARPCVSFLHANALLLWLRFAHRLHEIGVTCLHFIRSVLGYGYVVVAFASATTTAIFGTSAPYLRGFFRSLSLSFPSVYVHGSHKKHV